MKPTFSSFGSLLKQSFLSTNRQLLVLLKTLFFLIAYYLLRDICVTALLSGGGWYIQRRFGTPHHTLTAVIILEVLAVIYLFFLIMEFNGALGLVFSRIAMGRTDSRAIASESFHESIPFFINGFKTGMIMFLGQIFLFCPCFVFLNNFIFSPFLYLYEGLRGKEAEERSVEISRGFGWMVLNRTMVLLILSYLFFIIAVTLLFLNFLAAGIAFLAIGCFYVGLFQANFVFKFYTESVIAGEAGKELKISYGYRALTILGVFLLIGAYVLFRYLPSVIYNIHIWTRS